MGKGFKRIFVISDMHLPYAHPDLISYLKEVAAVYKPDRVLCTGDELDYHCLSFHDTDADLLGPLAELQLAQDMIADIGKIFPKMDIVESNHGSMVYRRALSNSLPRQLFRSYQEITKAPKGWVWHRDLTVPMSNGQTAYMCHGKTASPGMLSQTMAMCSIQGHYHEKYHITYWANPNGLFWDMHVGCMADDNSLALAYNNTNLKRPIVGCAIILDGHPRLLPMVLDCHGRWIGKLV